MARRAWDATATPVRERIMAAATEEFLDKGFQAASLRSIATAADLTTGAIYGYFSSKADLFDAIVSPAAEEYFDRFLAAQRSFYALPSEQQSFDAMVAFEENMIHDFYDYIFDNRQVFLLVLSKSAGTRWEHYVERFVDVEVKSTERYALAMGEQGVQGIDGPLSRVLAELFFRGFFQPVILGFTREEAHAFVTDYERFFNAGYRALMEGTPKVSIS